MPNAASVLSPLTLIAFGRCGTSLLQTVFEAHPDFEVAGETTELIFGSYLAAELASGIIPDRLDQGGQAVPANVRRGEAVRALLVAMLPGDKPLWMQKPIGLPVLRPTLGAVSSRLGRSRPVESPRPPCPPDWYWDVMSTVFPGGRFLTILRHPCDVVLSAAEYWGIEQDRAWTRLAELVDVMSHEDSRIEFAVDFDSLVSDAERELRRLFDHFEIRWDDAVLPAMRRLSAPGVRREKEVAGDMSRRDQWQGLHPSAAPPEAIETIAAFWRRWGREFDLPAAFSHARSNA